MDSLGIVSLLQIYRYIYFFLFFFFMQAFTALLIECPGSQYFRVVWDIEETPSRLWWFLNSSRAARSGAAAYYR